MPAKPKMRIESRFPAVREAAHDATRAAIELALNVGEGEAEKRLERIDNSRGYELPIDVQQERLGFQSGKIVYEPWYGRFFEYGTTKIPAASFMRPAHRKMRKTFLGLMGTEVEGFIKRRARVR